MDDTWHGIKRNDDDTFEVEYVELKKPFNLKIATFGFSFIYDMWCDFNENRKAIVIAYGNPTFKEYVERRVSMMFR